MADRGFLPHGGTLEVEVKELFCSITVGSSGAVTASSGKGIDSVTKESTAGQYTIALSDSYNALLDAGVMVLDDTDSDPTTVAVVGRIKSEAVSNATPTVVVQGYNHTDGSAADFASGAKVLVRLVLRNSSVS
jgi:hypothetical protein